MFLKNLKTKISTSLARPHARLFCGKESSEPLSSGALQSFLAQPQAENRFNVFDPKKANQISYDLIVKIMKGESYKGRVDIKFALSQLSNDLFLDYAGSTIDDISVNNSDLPKSDKFASLKQGRFVNLPQNSLVKGENQLSIKFSNKYVNDGNGLHSFTDTDGQQYIYSNLEPYHANKIFPCFDQPDLKAKFNLTVLAPKEWNVISNELITEKQPSAEKLEEFLKPEEQDKYKVWSFNPTPPLSTYLYALIAGPYKEIRRKSPYKNLPMSLYSRESLFKHLEKQSEEIFEITEESMKFFEKFFGYNYPFSKYDQIFCPEFNVGAMENPGAVTFNDRYVFKDDVTRETKSNLANTISHELSHMWFGNLVTMKWWNDLWLNESFADYISHHCLANVDLKHSQLEDSWHMFFKRKGWGYREDQLDTTHPIAGDVLNTEQAENIFDGITYSKGAATIKQLLCLMGEENFSKAMKQYFHRYQWSNASFGDFIKNLEEFYITKNANYPSDLQAWQKDWWKIAGLNECTPEWSRKSNELIIRQGYAHPDHRTLRNHKMKIAYFDKNGKIYEIQDVVLKNEKETRVQMPAQTPEAVLLNYYDEAFIKVRLDAVSIEFFKQNLASVDDELTRAIVWRALWDMLRDGQLPSTEFVEISCRSLAKEKSDSILSNLLLFTEGGIRNFTPKSLRSFMSYRVFNSIYEALLNLKADEKNRIVLLRNWLIQTAEDPQHIQILLDWFDGKHEALKGIELGIKDRWGIVRAAFRSKDLSQQVKESYFEQVAKIDPSDVQKSMRKLCDGLAVTGESRRQLWQSYFDADIKESVHLMGDSMRGFNDESRLEELEQYHREFFDRLINEIELFSHTNLFSF